MDEESGQGQARLELYVESLRARMPPRQFILLMRGFNAWLTGGGGLPGLPLAAEEHLLFTPEVQGEMLALMGLASAAAADREGRSRRLAGGQSLVPPEGADDPEPLAAVRRRKVRAEQDALDARVIARAGQPRPVGEGDASPHAP